jgi:Uma2 family endonuclease
MATNVATPKRRFRVGTTGWTAAHLDDPDFEAEWVKGRYEIVEGVLTRMPAAYYDSSVPLQRLVQLLNNEVHRTDPGGDVVTEVDLIVGEMRVPVVDALYLSPEDRAAQKRANAAQPKPKLKYGRILVPPTLVIENVSRGHEAHDRVLKRGWYAGLGVPNYWLLDPGARSLECLVLRGSDYVLDVEGKDKDELRPTLFPNLVIRLASLWVE